MQSYEKGGLQVSADGGVLGVSLLRIAHLDPSQTDAVLEEADVKYRDEPTDMIGSALLNALHGVRHEVAALRRDLYERSLEGRCRRLWAWIRQLLGR